MHSQQPHLRLGLRLQIYLVLKTLAKNDLKNQPDRVGSAVLPSSVTFFCLFRVFSLFFILFPRGSDI
jgi:hypothetical protein